MPIVRISLLSGRTKDQKKQPVSNIVDAFRDIGARPNAVTTIFEDVDKSD